MEKTFKKVTFEALGQERVGYMEPIYPDELAQWAISLVTSTAKIKSIESVKVDYEHAKANHMNNLITHHNKVKSYESNEQDQGNDEIQTLESANEEITQSV